MVQEYLEGQSLRDLLAGGVPPLKKTLGLATEIGEALRAAHKAGIVHRDLKPDNIFVSTDGHAKVLDFSLVKLSEGAGFGGDSTKSPTAPTANGCTSAPTRAARGPSGGDAPI